MSTTLEDCHAIVSAIIDAHVLFENYLKGKIHVLKKYNPKSFLNYFQIFWCGILTYIILVSLIIKVDCMNFTTIVEFDKLVTQWECQSSFHLQKIR